MSASLVTLANFGRKKNFRTTDMLPMVETLIASGELEQLVCQVNAGFHFRKTTQAIPTWLRYGMRVYEKVLKKSIPREIQDKIFDYCAARRLARADVTFFHGAFFLPKTVRRARALGSITVDISVSAYFGANATLEREELTRLGFPDFKGYYAGLTAEMAPLDQIDYMILMSEFTKKTYLAAGYPEDHIFIAHIDIDTERFSPLQNHEPADVNASLVAKPRPFRVVYMAFTQPLKGLHYLLDAWEQLPELADAELLISGFFSEMPEELRQQYIQRMEKDPRITWVPGTQTPEQYYREASVFVFPSLTEGFGRSVVEAMACGVPVITTEHAEAIVENGKTGFVVPIRDSQAIKEKIQYLYDNRDVAEKMGRDARNAVLSKKPFGEQVEEIYQEIMTREQKKLKKTKI